MSRPFSSVRDALAERGFLRRFAAILNHRQAGFRANGMAVWQVPAERIPEVGCFVAGYRNVSHCYERPTYPDWPYSVFSMIHHQKVARVEDTALAISREVGITDYQVLYSTAEYKKIRLSYFIEAYDHWEALCVAAADEVTALPHPPTEGEALRTPRGAQSVKFTFFKMPGEARRLPQTERAALTETLRGHLDASGEARLTRAYTTAGTRGDVDVLLWQVHETCASRWTGTRSCERPWWVRGWTCRARICR